MLLILLSKFVNFSPSCSFSALSSSYTQSSSDNKAGAPEKSPEEKAPKTIQNEESLDRQGGSNSVG